ncbi:MAG: hypothetical protein FJ265_04380 [Planctomycetes bacterium]|nr:hypothetical protein [Planctomycetota bacterium]
MSEPLPLRRLAERVLAKGGDLPLALLLEHLVPVRALRGLARRLGLTPKGGFRIDRAPGRVLAPLLAELRDGEQLDQVLALLRPVEPTLPPAAAGESEGPPGAEADSTALLALREAELVRLRDELERARAGAARARERESELARRLQQAEREAAVSRQRAAAEQPPAARPARADAGRDLQLRIRELENELEGFRQADEALRRQLAHNQSRLRALEEDHAELEALLPKGRRRRSPPPAPAEDRRFRLPHFLPSFYKSLAGKDRRSVERTLQAILLFCTEGHAYPGLEVKQLGGQDTWSLRASLGLRVYFRQREDGDVDLLEVADREEQNTTLRRLKDKP